MKKVFKIEVDCAHCASKMESAINKLEGVKEASINFLTQKLTIEFLDNDTDKVMKDVVKACKKVERDCEIYL